MKRRGDWRSVGDITSELTEQGTEFQIFYTDSIVLATAVTGRLKMVRLSQSSVKDRGRFRIFGNEIVAYEHINLNLSVAKENTGWPT